MVGCHVDDLLVAGCQHDRYFQAKVKELRQAFPFGSWKSAMEESINFCGCELTQKADFSIELNQERYTDFLNELNLSRERKQCRNAPLDDQEN